MEISTSSVPSPTQHNFQSYLALETAPSLARSKFPCPYEAFGLITADFNADGKLDLVTTVNSLTGAISVFLGNGDGTFQSGVTYITGGQFDNDLVAGDFNADGELDLALNTNQNGFTLLFGAGDGTFPTGVAYSVGSAFLPLAAGDFNGDGTLDLAGYLKSGASGFALLLQGPLPGAAALPSGQIRPAASGTASPAQNITVSNTGTRQR